MSENRLGGADFVRAAACLTVLFHHLAQRLDLHQDFGPALNFFRVFAQMGTFGVAMFFVLSGFLLARPFWVAFDRGEAMPSLRTYAMRRAARILPGFWLALLVSFVLSVSVFGTVLDGEAVLRVVAGALLVADWHWVTFFPVEVNGPLWSISFEITAYLLLPLAMGLPLLLRRWAGGWSGRLVFLGVIGLVLVVHVLMLTYYPIDDVRRSWEFGMLGGAKYWMPRYNPFSLFAMFAFGMLAAGVGVRLAARRHWGFDVVALGAIAMALFVLNRHLAQNVDPSGFGWLGIPYGFPWFQLAVALFLAVAPSSQFVAALFDNRATRFVATISFGIYIWHMLVIELWRVGFLPGFYYGNIKDGVTFTTTALAIVAVSFAIGWVSWVMVEKPAIGWARRREQAQPARLAPQAAE